MNRLRFRAWDKFDKEMLNVHGINYDAEGVWTKEMIDDESDGGFIYFSDIELLQSTGLFDKNGKEIFEGDIVKNEINEVGYIEWSKCRFNFCDSVGHFYLFSIGARQPFEILGNKFEHPHLLGED
ncbi:YopX family protein [Mammaliicoccus sciuri]|uniref:YopX family protein n=1 Tax=Mammaliicoccus sciuri TaxID=1296 RepID=UPI0021D296E3|nr:YopX family protein [Mammaliicoccus sciuri]UXV14889.1 YopX family protein [Mammaliicoccus sciuri]UXV25930.1 YopX family protein [Mammaliicoccus sciuri]